MRYFDNDVAKASFSLATSERGYTTSSGTQVPERTEWHNIVCWRGLAQIAERFVKKGTLLYIEGKIRSRSYDDQNGVKRYITEIVADNLELLGRRVQENDTMDLLQNPTIRSTALTIQAQRWTICHSKLNRLLL